MKYIALLLFTVLSANAAGLVIFTRPAGQSGAYSYFVGGAAPTYVTVTGRILSSQADQPIAVGLPAGSYTASAVVGLFGAPDFATNGVPFTVADGDVQVITFTGAANPLTLQSGKSITSGVVPAVVQQPAGWFPDANAAEVFGIGLSLQLAFEMGGLVIRFLRMMRASGNVDVSG